MARHARMGELLSDMVSLSGHDVEEILQEQMLSRKRFGEIALSLGLCQPMHIWTAWSKQLSEGPQRVDLDTLGIDTQAVAALPREWALQHRAIPVRAIHEQLVVAVDDTSDERAQALTATAGQEVLLVLADSGQLDRALAHYYPAPQAAN